MLERNLNEFNLTFLAFLQGSKKNFTKRKLTAGGFDLIFEE